MPERCAESGGPYFHSYIDFFHVTYATKHHTNADFKTCSILKFLKENVAPRKSDNLLNNSTDRRNDRGVVYFYRVETLPVSKCQSDDLKWRWIQKPSQLMAPKWWFQSSSTKLNLLNFSLHKTEKWSY